jgi:uncharacterized protein YfaS (alpha-2-macroglobulin family)
MVAASASLPVYGQADQLSVNLDSDTYTFGETITVTGFLNATTVDQPLLIQVVDPDGNVDRIDQVTVAADGEYRYAFRAGGVMSTFGTYTVIVSYKGTITAETSFVFDFPRTAGGMYNLIIDGQAYRIEYLLTDSGNRLLNITADVSRNATFPGDASLIVFLSA